MNIWSDDRKKQMVSLFEPLFLNVDVSLDKYSSQNYPLNWKMIVKKRKLDYDIMITTYKRPEMLSILLNSIPKGKADIFIYFDNNDIENYNKFKDIQGITCVLIPEQWFCQHINNYHCSRSTKKGVIVLNDDMRLEPNALEELIKCFEGIYPDTDGLVGMNQYLLPTGSQCAAWLIGKKFSDRFPNREAIYQGYIGRFGDTELMQTAQMLGKFFWCENSKIEHYQPKATNEVNFVIDDVRREQLTTKDKNEV